MNLRGRPAVALAAALLSVGASPRLAGAVSGPAATPVLVMDRSEAIGPIVHSPGGPIQIVTVAISDSVGTTLHADDVWVDVPQRVESPSMACDRIRRRKATGWSDSPWQEPGGPGANRARRRRRSCADGDAPMRGLNERRRSRLCLIRGGPIFPCVKIYTRTGDDGTTGLLGPGRVPKSAPRVEAFGSVDELNAALGVARSLDAGAWITTELAGIQGRLFSLGAELAATVMAPLANVERITPGDVAALEQIIDRLESELPPLVNFILPAGHVLATQLHLARTVCRRAERRVVALTETAPVEPLLVHYLNRLADLLFVMARWCNHRAGVPEVEWRAGAPLR